MTSMSRRFPWDVIASLEATTSRLGKEHLVKCEADADHKEFFEGCRLALDPLITFGLKKVPEKTDSDGKGVDWETFTLAITGFVNRQITGNAARDMLAEMMKNSTQAQWNGWYRRILIKDLRCGVSDKTINKVVENVRPEYSIPTFSCQLAHDSANHEAKLAGQKLVEVKLDGVRVISIVYPDGRVDQFSRNGKELVNFEHIKDQFRKTVSGITEPTVFDGEVMSSSFQDLMKQVHRKSDVDAGDAILYLFDYLPLADFEQGSWSKPQRERSAKLHHYKDLWAEETPNIQILDNEDVDLDTEQGRRQFMEINQRAIDGGYEGIMIKDPNAGYECKRSHSWLKMKPFIEVSLEVINVEEGTGRNVGRLGALVCSGTEFAKTITVNVGSGFSDDQRCEFWSSRDRVLGQVVEVRADAITQNQDGTYSLRFPRFLRFRGFEAGEKL